MDWVAIITLSGMLGWSFGTVLHHRSRIRELDMRTVELAEMIAILAKAVRNVEGRTNNLEGKWN